MTDKLIVQKHDYGPHGYGTVWRISWRIMNGDMDVGATLGQDDEYKKNKPPENREEWESWTADRAASKTPGVVHDAEGFFWDEEKEARRALAMIRVALNQDRDIPAKSSNSFMAG